MRLHWYIRYDELKDRFVVLSIRPDGFTSLPQLKSLRNVDLPVEGGRDMDQAASAQPDHLNQAFRFVTYLMFDRLEFYTLNYELSNKGQSRSELDAPLFRVNALSLVFAGLPREVATALEVIPADVS